MIDTTWKLAKTYEAVAYGRELLTLDPTDPMGQAEIMLDLLLEVREDKEAVKLMKKFPGANFLSWYWTSALLHFRKSGDCDSGTMKFHESKLGSARTALKDAYRRNPHVLPVLLRDEDQPSADELPQMRKLTITKEGIQGDPVEAKHYVKTFHNHWRRTKGGTRRCCCLFSLGAMRWLESMKSHLVAAPMPPTDAKIPGNPTYHTCGFCGAKSQKLKLCSACEGIHYCNAVCQKKHWKAHKVRVCTM